MLLPLLMNLGMLGPTTPAPPSTIDQTPRGGPGGYASNKFSSLSRTRDLPGLKTMIEADDERVMLAVLEEFTKVTLQ